MLPAVQTTAENTLHSWTPRNDMGTICKQISWRPELLPLFHSLYLNLNFRSGSSLVGSILSAKSTSTYFYEPYRHKCGSFCSVKVCLFVCNRGDTYYSIMAGSRQGSYAKPLSLLFLTPGLMLSSHQHRMLVSHIRYCPKIIFLWGKNQFF